MTAPFPLRTRLATFALAVILAITAAWWALALWPVSNAPAWLVITRDTCFGTAETGLPNAGGWLVLVGQPLCMLSVLLAAWGRDVRAGLRAMGERVAGQFALGTMGAVLLAGVMGVTVRVRTADAEPFATSQTEVVASQLNRLSDKPKPMALVDQHGDTVTLERFKGRPVIVTFAFAHCTTVCPLIVNDALNVRDRLAGDRKPVVLVVTLDPWRDTPSRLPSIARQWGMRGDAHLLSGDAEAVERVLNAWRIPRVRNEKTGDVSHPSVAYVIGYDGRIAYVVSGTQALMKAAVEAL